MGLIRPMVRDMYGVTLLDFGHIRKARLRESRLINDLKGFLICFHISFVFCLGNTSRSIART
jgi:hypothetical protein